MKEMLIANIVGFVIAFIGITTFFVLWLKAERKLAKLKKNKENK